MAFYLLSIPDTDPDEHGWSLPHGSSRSASVNSTNLLFLAFLAAVLLLFSAVIHPSLAQDTGSLATSLFDADTADVDASANSVSSEEAFIDGLIAAYSSEHGTAGYVVSVVKDGKPLFAKGYGFADAEAGVLATGDATRFWIGSISKTFLWTGVMMAVERGEIDLDADVNSYLRRYRLPDTHGPLTMNDLMAHRVGLEDAYKIFLPEIGALPLPEALSASEPKKVFEASGPTAYSNWATTLAAAVLEEATGREYADILYNDLLLPLGMRDTALDGTSPVAKRVPVSRSYTPTAKGLKDDGQIELGAFSSIGGMTSTAADMAKWVSMHLNEGSFNGVRILSPESYALMRERAFNDRPSSGDMAHGMMDRVHRGYRVYGHGGSINSFLSDMSIAPELGLGIFISQNTESARAIGAVTRLLIDRAIEERQGAPLFDRIIAPKDDEDEGAGNDAAVKNAEEVAGSYLSNRRAYKGFEKVFAIDAVTTFVASGENLYAEGSKHNPMRRLAPDLYEDRFGYRTTFIRNDAGKVVRFAGSSGSSTSERIGKTDGPAGLTYALGALAGLIATTWLGLWRRFGRPDETTIAGRALSLIVLVSTVPAIVFAVILGQFLEKVSNLSYAGIFSDYPPSNMEMVIFLGSLTAVAGIVAFVSVVPAWTASGWSIFRKVHHSAFGIVYLAAGFMLWRWGLAFSSTMVG